MGADDSSALRSGGVPSGDTKNAGQLMAMLDHGVSAADLETTLSAWLEAGAIDQSTAAAARRLNARLWEESRRESLLRVLYDTATDLTGIRDVEAVLKAIVRPTRSLIGSDIAYLSLNDYDTGAAYVRVTDGATTALFRNIRMPLGEGVLGAVATGEATAQSADYLMDENKSHLESSDTAVAAVYRGRDVSGRALILNDPIANELREAAAGSETGLADTLLGLEKIFPRYPEMPTFAGPWRPASGASWRR